MNSNSFLLTLILINSLLLSHTACMASTEAFPVSYKLKVVSSKRVFRQSPPSPTGAGVPNQFQPTPPRPAV
ncbi:hypothetical protein OWV82_007662 [Melia azedarach]|uniref:Uncharacterized protein n=1 Tax=Melia azedarach TaxID=155640 RepID=A0ACC1Y8X2_MELAZ|nr:hypothetical protein OWV82_007662 [Melia azedarach]